MNLTLSQSAIERVTALRAQENNPELYLRVGVSGGGCSGFQYLFSFDTTPKPDDLIIECGDVQVLVDPTSYEWLQNVNIDYVEDLMGSSFRVNNPNAKSSCGCGTSFSPI